MIFTWLFWIAVLAGIFFFSAFMVTENPWLLIGLIIMIVVVIVLLPLMNSEYPSCVIVDITTYEKYHGILYYIAKKECIIKSTGEEYTEYELVILE